METLKNKIPIQKVPSPLTRWNVLRDLVPFVFAFVMLGSLPLSANASPYSDNLRHDLKRGVKNILTSPLEIAVGFQEYHERAGWPFVRQGIGILEGTGKMVLRLGSGAVDLGAAWIPGLQQGFPVKPEQLF